MAKQRKEDPSSKASTPVDDYMAFIDALVKLQSDVSACRVREKQAWPDLPQFKTINAFLANLNNAQREVLATLLQHARDGGIHDTLVYLTDEINLSGLRIVRNGREMAVEPFGMEMYYDWISRCDGDPWPEADDITEA